MRRLLGTIGLLMLAALTLAGVECLWFLGSRYYAAILF